MASYQSQFQSLQDNHRIPEATYKTRETGAVDFLSKEFGFKNDNTNTKLYDAILHLRNDLVAVNKELVQNPSINEAKSASILLVMELDKALDAYGREREAGKSLRDYQQALLNLANSSFDQIYLYTPAIIATPGYINPYIASFNNFLEWMYELFGKREHILSSGEASYERTGFFEGQLPASKKLIQNFDLAKDKIFGIKRRLEDYNYEDDHPRASMDQ